MGKRGIFRKIAVFTIIGFVVLAVVHLVTVHIFMSEIKEFLTKEEASRLKSIAKAVIDCRKREASNLLNSFAMWTKFTRKVKERDLKWISDMLDDPQVHCFDGVGVVLENCTLLYHQGFKPPEDFLRLLIERVKKRFPIGSTASRFYHTFLKNGHSIWLLSVSPLGNDDSEVLSHDVFYLATSMDRIVKVLKALDENILLLDAPLQGKAGYSIPVKGESNKPLVWISVRLPSHIKSSIEKLYTFEAASVLLVAVYVGFVAFILTYYYKRVKRDFYDLIDSVVSVVGLSPEFDKLAKLANNSGELGNVARRLKPLLEHISFCVLSDPLTGVFNRRVFFEKLSEELDRFKRYKRPFSVALLDLDDFKKVNDTYGHPFGDLVLSKIAIVVRENIRRTDIFARVGGEEFGLIMPETTSEAAEKVCEKLREVIAETAVGAKEKVNVTVSFGVTQAKESDTVESIYERADRALYLAKKEGKNRVVRLD